MMLIIEFVVAFLFILVLGYLVPAGRFYYWYHVRRTPANESLRIQRRRPPPGQVWQEIRLSLVTVVIFAAMATLLFELFKAGRTSLYWPLYDRPLWYLPVSVFLCAAIHDTYFYW